VTEIVLASSNRPFDRLDSVRRGAWGRPSERLRKYHEEAPRIRPNRELVEVMNLAIDLQTPLLLTGQPGTGKTTAAYWAAWNLGLGQDSIFHIQVRSDSLAQDLRYRFDAVDYFRASQANAGKIDASAGAGLGRGDYLLPGELWQAYEASTTRPVIVLFDEIDKAPRDFPNDLLLELDINGFDVPTRDGGPKSIRAQRENLKLVLFTSNRERALPDAFLRRCLHHEIRLDREGVLAAVRAHVPADERLLDCVYDVWRSLDGSRLRHRPDLAELILWVRALERGGIGAEQLAGKAPKELPYLATIIKDPADLERLA
jgi:MoxR-like ATPase